MTKAMILAAGQGTRIRPLTKGLPKPMIPILGKPVMAYLVEHLAKYGVTEIMVNVSYLHEKIEEYFGEGHQFGVQIGYSFEGYTNDAGEVMPYPIGSAGGMKKIQEFGGFFDQPIHAFVGGDARQQVNGSPSLALGSVVHTDLHAHVAAAHAQHGGIKLATGGRCIAQATMKQRNAIARLQAQHLHMARSTSGQVDFGTGGQINGAIKTGHGFNTLLF